MNTYERVFVRDTKVGHAERNRIAVEATKKMAEEIKKMLGNKK